MKSEEMRNIKKIIALAVWVTVAWLLLVVGGRFKEEELVNSNHNTQELCEYSNETRCVNVWIPESMKNPKSAEVKK